jgi:hypothetical protein
MTHASAFLRSALSPVRFLSLPPWTLETWIMYLNTLGRTLTSRFSGSAFRLHCPCALVLLSPRWTRTRTTERLPEPPSRRAAEPPSRRAAEPPSRRAAVHIVFWSNADLLSLFQALLISVLPDSRATVPRYGGRAILGTVSEACNNKALK